MFGLYDKEGILRYTNSDKDACIAYAELFNLSASTYSLMSLSDDKLDDINLDQNQEESSN